MSIISTKSDFDRAFAAGFRPRYVHVNGFAEACYNDNTLDELLSAKGKIIDDRICRRDWGLTVAKYRAAITDAIESSMYECEG